MPGDQRSDRQRGELAGTVVGAGLVMVERRRQQLRPRATGQGVSGDQRVAREQHRLRGHQVGGVAVGMAWGGYCGQRSGQCGQDGLLTSGGRRHGHLHPTAHRHQGLRHPAPAPRSAQLPNHLSRRYLLQVVTSGVTNFLDTCVDRHPDSIDQGRNGADVIEMGVGQQHRCDIVELMPDFAYRGQDRVRVAGVARLDRVIVNAGISQGKPVGTGEFSVNLAIANTNFVAAVAQCEAAMEIFRSQGDGHLVVISSVAALRGMPGFQVYSATKAGMATLAEAIRAETLATAINVTTIFPGYVESELGGSGEPKSLRVSIERGMRAMIKAIEQERSQAKVPAWPWEPIGYVIRHMPCLHARTNRDR